jgi:hypothetical protein
MDDRGAGDLLGVPLESLIPGMASLVVLAGFSLGLI